MRTCKHCHTKFDPKAGARTCFGNGGYPCEPVPRGFGAMSQERVREIAAKGGKVAHERGTAHQWGAEEARRAGYKGGVAPHVSRGKRSTGAPA